MPSSLTAWARRSFPVAHNLARAMYWRIREFRVQSGGTAFQERFWAKRHLRRESDWGEPTAPTGQPWIEGYWESRHHPHRDLLVETVARFDPQTVLELGCNCGPNLYRLAKHLPDTAIRGIDINAHAVSEGRRLLAEEGVRNVELERGSMELLRQCPDRGVDVVLADATLLYVGPDLIELVLQDLVRVAAKAIVLVEWHAVRKPEEDVLGVYEGGGWRRDYVALLKMCRPMPKTIRLTKIPAELWPSPNWQRWGYVVEAVK